jgi:hypothetical protein
MVGFKMPIGMKTALPIYKDKIQARHQFWRLEMQGTVLAETEAFITRQRDLLLKQREDIFNQQQVLQRQLDEVDGMLSKFDVFEGKGAAPRQQMRGRRASGSRRGSKRDALLKVIREGNGLSRGEILQQMGLKGDKSGEMSVSNALTALTKANQVTRRDGKYVIA